jgi:hypothetical protein
MLSRRIMGTRRLEKNFRPLLSHVARLRKRVLGRSLMRQKLIFPAFDPEADSRP